MIFWVKHAGLIHAVLEIRWQEPDLYEELQFTRTVCGGTFIDKPLKDYLQKAHRDGRCPDCDKVLKASRGK